jgi:hypothetical protein
VQCLGGNKRVFEVFQADPGDVVNEKYSAFLASELGGILPSEISGEYLEIWKDGRIWNVTYGRTPVDWSSGINLANAMGRMALFLDGHKLLPKQS